MIKTSVTTYIHHHTQKKQLVRSTQQCSKVILLVVYSWQ